MYNLDLNMHVVFITWYVFSSFEINYKKVKIICAWLSLASISIFKLKYINYISIYIDDVQFITFDG